MKHVKMFGKSVPLIAIVLAGLLTIGGVSAALLTYYGTIKATVPIIQSILVDGDTTPVTKTFDATVAGSTVNGLHFIENRADVFADIVLDTTYNPFVGVTEIVTRYDTEITDDPALSPAFFGKSSHELVTIEPATTYTLDDLFAEDGLQYSYTVLNGGDYDGASPIIAMIHLDDGRHVVLFPGWGSRTGAQSLQYSDTVSKSTVDGGVVVVDFVVYESDFVDRWSNGGSYPAWTATKLLTGCPVTGSEVVASVAIAHQSGGCGESDQLESLSYGSESYVFTQLYERPATYTLAPGQKIYFVTRYTFDVALDPLFGPYKVTTTVSPVP